MIPALDLACSLLGGFSIDLTSQVVIWNSADKTSNVTLSSGDKTATANNSSYEAARTVTNNINPSGSLKKYAEVTVVALDNAADLYIGLRLTADAITGGNPIGFGTFALYRSDGQTHAGGGWTDLLGVNASYTVADVIGVAINEATGEIWFSKNNTWLGSGNPGGGTNPTFSTMPAGDHALYFSTDNNAGNVEVTFATALVYAPPSGFTPF